MIQTHKVGGKTWKFADQEKMTTDGMHSVIGSTP